MKTRKIIVIVALAVMLILYGVGFYITNQRYVAPEQKYYGLNDTAVCNGISYTLLGIDMYEIDELAKKYDFVPEDFYIDTSLEEHYFVACMEITKLTEDGIITDMGEFNRYENGNYFEPFIESHINGRVIGMKTEMEVGETVTYYYVKSFNYFNFSEETWANMDESDMWLRFYDDENDYECFFGTDL